MKSLNVDIPARRSGIGIAFIILLTAGCGGGGYGGGGAYGGAATLSGLAITPGSETVINGTSAKLTAIGSYSDGSKADLSNTVTWTSSVPGVASVGNTGVVTGNAVGVSTISASVSNGMYSATSASDTVTVTTASLAGITIAPATASLAMGATVTLTATGGFSDGSNGNISGSVTWASSDTSVATVNASGIATAVGMGTTTITASLSGQSNTATLTVH